MAEFILQENANVSPTTCFFCGSFEGPFVNTMTSTEVGRTILICAPQPEGRRKAGCAGQIAVACGGCGPEGIDDYEQQMEIAEQHIAELREKVEELEPLANALLAMRSPAAVAAGAEE